MVGLLIPVSTSYSFVGLPINKKTMPRPIFVGFVLVGVRLQEVALWDRPNCTWIGVHKISRPKSNSVYSNITKDVTPLPTGTCWSTSQGNFL